MSDQSKGNTLTKQKSQIAKQLLQEKYAKIRQQSTSNSHANFSDLYQSRMSIDDFQILKCVGKGGFGEVLLCKHKESGSIYAVKKLRKKEMMNRKQVFHVWQERNALVSVDSKWIIKLHYTFQDDVYLYFVMDYLPGGDLMFWLIQKQTFSEEETKFYIAELILAVEEIHKMGYVHRDLKPDNILLDKSGHIKLTDFGLCKLLQIKEETHPQVPEDYSSIECDTTPTSDVERKDQLTSLKGNEKQKLYQNTIRRDKAYSVVGSPGYVSPEVLKKQGYSWECDFWSIGIIMFEALFGYPPFFSDSPVQTCKKIVRWRHFLEYPLDTIKVSDAALDLMQHLICDAEDRVGSKYTVEELKSHSFFKGIQWDKIHDTTPPFKLNLQDELDTRYFDEYDLQEVLNNMQYVKLQPQKKFRRKKEEDLLFEQFTYQRPNNDKKSRKTIMDVFSPQ